MKVNNAKRPKYITIVVWGTLLVFMCTLAGCAASMHGYTQRRANNKYWLVDQESETFGYKRVQYSMGYFRTLKGFVKEHGLPDFIYEYSPSVIRDAIRMYYIEENKVYIFEQAGFLPDSMYFKEVREINQSEQRRYNRMKKNQDRPVQ